MKAFICVPNNDVGRTYFTEENIALANSLGHMVWNETDHHMTADEIAEKIGDCDTYVTIWGSPRLDEKILAKAPNIKLLTHLCGTVVPFVSDAMWDRGIKVITGNWHFADSVAEGTIGYILSAQRDIPGFSSRFKNEHQWKPLVPNNLGLIGKTVGLVSYGAIAKALVKMLKPFRVKLLVYDIKPIPEEDKKEYNITQVSLETVFAESDIVSVHTPLNPHTHHLIGRELLSLIKPGALFVNTSRGKVIDQAALEEELATGRFRAFLDVYEQEPPPADCRLFTLPNVTMMPHMGGPTVDLRQYIARDLLLESAAFIDRGEPLQHEVSREMAAQMSNS